MTVIAGVGTSLLRVDSDQEDGDPPDILIPQDGAWLHRRSGGSVEDYPDTPKGRYPASSTNATCVLLARRGAARACRARQPRPTLTSPSSASPRDVRLLFVIDAGTCLGCAVPLGAALPGRPRR
jgi:hypothetical protein